MLRGMTNTILTSCRNRNLALAISLASWLQQEVDEIVIVDWGSKTAVRVPDDPRIKLIRVEASEWKQAIAQNLAIKHATSTNILKMDADDVLTPYYDFFGKHRLTEGVFYAGNWARARIDNEKYINGVLYVRKEDLIKVNGYREWYSTYGGDDEDLYRRLVESGLTRKDITPDMAFHLSHPDAVRCYGNPDESIHKNVADGKAVPWTPQDKQHEFTIIWRGNNHGFTTYPGSPVDTATPKLVN